MNLDILLNGLGWEMKNVTNAGSSVDNQIKRARIKWMKAGSGKMRAVVTCNGCDDSFDQVVNKVEGKLRAGESAYVIGENRELRHLKK